jgi:protocatechuate 3,4-dioxygenase alpha subunit
MSFAPTPSQTIGPFFSLGLEWLCGSALAAPGAGEAVTVEGRVLDGDGRSVPDALLEIWCADDEGRYPPPDDARGASVAPSVRGFARIATDAGGGFRFTTRKPGRVAQPGGGAQAPHLLVTIFMRGLLRHARTRMYFPDEPANAEDAVLQLVPAERRHTLIARRSVAATLEWTINMQGDTETVFFDY